MKSIIYGAGNNCAFVLNALKGDEIVGIVDADESKNGMEIEGIRVYGRNRLLENDYDRIVVSVRKNHEAIKQELAYGG